MDGLCAACTRSSPIFAVPLPSRASRSCFWNDNQMLAGHVEDIRAPRPPVLPSPSVLGATGTRSSRPSRLADGAPMLRVPRRPGPGAAVAALPALRVPRRSRGPAPGPRALVLETSLSRAPLRATSSAQTGRSSTPGTGALSRGACEARVSRWITQAEEAPRQLGGLYGRRTLSAQVGAASYPCLEVRD